MNKKLIPAIVGLALLALLISTVQASRVSSVAGCFSSLSLAIFVWVYYLLNNQVAELSQAESTCQDLYNHAPCGYYTLDRDGNFIAINDTALRCLGYSREEIIGKVKVTDLLTAKEVVTFQENFSRLQPQSWLKDVEAQIICKNGTSLSVLLSVTAIFDAEVNLMETRTTFLDITQWQEAAAILRQQHEELETRIIERTSELIETIDQLQRELFKRERVERALRQSEERFRSAFDYAAIGMAIVSPQGYFLKVNQSVCEILGYSEQELPGKNVAEITHPEDLNAGSHALEQILMGEIRAFQIEKRYVHSSGRLVWGHLSVSLVRDSQNQPLYFIAQIQDITVRKQAEAERAKLIAIVEATPDVVGMVNLDERISYLNSSARKIFGLGEHEDCTNLTISDVQPDWAYQLVCNQGIPAAIRDGVWVGETAFLSHDGREIPVSKLIIAHKSPDGSVNMFSTIARDITHQKQIAATLFETERRWRSLLENVRLVVVGLDNSGKVEYANPYFLELVGYTQAEVIGQDWFETFLPLHQKKLVQNNFLELLAHKLYIHNQTVIITKSGEERVIAWNNTRLQDTEGYIIGTLSIGEDITERQVIERMKDEFISVVSHELRTPLTSIHGALNLLSSGLVQTQSDKGRRVIEIAAASAERLVRLVNDILELERLESGKICLDKQPCNAAEIMEQAIDMIQVMANRAGISLSVTPQSIQFNADPDRIIQVLTNLLGNAIKFSSRGSTVWLTVEQGNWEKNQFSISNSQFSNVLFKIQDEGRGIPEDKIESIFERFHQVDTSDSRQKGGTGLGLAICRSIVQQHGGQIWGDSTLGKGSSFYFTLPA